jgi:hypothetical protein
VIGRKVLTVNRSLTITVLLFLLDLLVVCQTPSQGPDCSSLKYSRHKVSCLCGTVQVCSGDLCGRPSDYDLDDDITIELRDKAGMSILDSKKVIVETREEQGTTQIGTKVSYKRTERKFCFEGKGDGDYVLAFVLYKNGIPQPAVKFPTNYSRKRHKPCNSVYMVEPTCPK